LTYIGVCMYIAEMVKSQASSKSATATAAQRRSQADRTEATKRKLQHAAMSSLVDLGYARTTAVEVCRRAGVTRGALFHHYESLPHLLGDALEYRFCDLITPMRQGQEPYQNLAEWVQEFWARISTPDFKAVIEIWFAARNDPDATAPIQSATDRIAAQIAPHDNPRLKTLIEASPQALGFYHTAMEAMFGLLLGRATNTNHQPLTHEPHVLRYLTEEAARF